MPRFAIAAMLLLAVTLAAGAAALWYGGWLANTHVTSPGPTRPPPQRASDEDPVERAVAAIRDHDLGAVREYLAAGGDPDGADREGEILLNRAVLSGTPEILEALLAAGADPTLTGKNGLAPLAIAALAGRQAMLQRLMQANADADARRAAERSALARVTGASAAPSASGAAAATNRTSTSTAREAPSSTEKPEMAPAATPAPGLLASLPGDAADDSASLNESSAIAGLAINPVARPPLPAATAARQAGGTADAVSPPASSPPAMAATPPAGSPSAAGAPQAWVSAAQRHLAQLGYYKGPITGFAGPLTAEAVKRYQAVAGLPQDGLVSTDLLRRIGASIEPLGDAPAPAPPAASSAAASPTAAAGGTPVAATASAPAQLGQPAQPNQAAPAPDQGLQQVRNVLGQEFNSATRPESLREHCQANANAWVYDEAIGRSLFCRDVIGAPPR